MLRVLIIDDDTAILRVLAKALTSCGHTVEKKCAVLAAVQLGELSDDRYRNYLKLRGDLKELEATQTARAARQRRVRSAQRNSYPSRRSDWGED